MEHGNPSPGNSNASGDYDSDLTYDSVSLSSKLDTDWIAEERQSIIENNWIPDYMTRYEGHIFTDKVVYRPSDIMFVQVYIMDAFNKTLAGLTDRDNLFYSTSIEVSLTFLH